MTVVLVNPYRIGAGGGSDVTPAAVNWTDISVTNYDGYEESNAQTITAIDAPITLELSWTVTGDTPTAYAIRNSIIVASGAVSPLTFVANLNDEIKFAYGIGGGTAGKYATGTATVKNNSDGAATLDTFTYAVQYVYYPEYCIDADAWVDASRQARTLSVGDMLDVLTPDLMGVERRAIRAISFAKQPCVRLVTQSGVELTVSLSTPITQPDNSVVPAPESVGALAAVDAPGGVAWERIETCTPVGDRTVARIDVGDRTYAAADAHGARRFFSHNVYMKP